MKKAAVPTNMFLMKSAEESFFFFEWSHAETGLGGQRIAPVSSCSGQHRASVVLYASLYTPPPPSPSFWLICTHTVMQAKEHKHAQQSITWIQMKCHLREHILLAHNVLPKEKKAMHVFTSQKPAHTHTHTQRGAEPCLFQLSGFC